MGYRYTIDGQRLKLLYPGNLALTYARDNAGRATSVKDWLGKTTGFEYWPDGKRKKITNVNGTYAEYVYDNMRRLTKIVNHDGAGGIFSQHTYTLDLVGNRTQVDEILHFQTAVGGPPVIDAPSRGGPGAPGTPVALAPSRGPSGSGSPVIDAPARLPSPEISSTLYAYDKLYRLTAESGPAE